MLDDSYDLNSEEARDEQMLMMAAEKPLPLRKINRERNYN